MNEGSHVDDEVLWRADGTSFPAEYWSYPQRIDGVAVGAVVTFTDITQRKRAEAVVLQNVARAEELARLKSRFVSMASHELRTPLANILLACELIKNYGDAMPAERSQSVLSGLLTGVSSMVRTLDDLLLSGNLEEGNLPYTPARFDLPDFLRRCCLEVEPELPSRIEIALRDAVRVVAADERLLHHILKNLLENALKYSPPDTVVELGVEAGPDSLTLSVRDRGIGVPEAERQFLFDAFSRASNVGDRPGSGLGLFIAQKCVQAHGGQLRYAPQPGGSFFSVTIPLATVG
jgi:signal transduction histidine kinase